MSEHALNRLCRFADLQRPKDIVVLPEYWSVKKAGRLGALRRMVLYGNPGTPEGRRKAGLLLQEKLRADPELAKRWRIVTAKEIKRPSPSLLLAEFIGILIGDGGIRSQYQVTVAFNRATEFAYARWLQSAVKRLFGLESFLVLEKKSLGGSIVISSVRLVRHLERIAGLRPGNKLRNGLDVPGWIWQRRSYQEACLRGLMDTDGGPYLHRYRVNGKWYAYPKLCFYSKSPKLLQSVFRLFTKLGFHPRVARSDRVFIDRSDEAKRFYHVVGSRHKRHYSLVLRQD